MYKVLLASKLELLLILLIAVIFGCGEEPAPSLFDPNEQSKPTPVISSMIPPDSTFAGAGELVINGDNFSSVIGENLVFFDEVLANVLEASQTQLKVLPPNIVRDSIEIRIAVQGTELFSPSRFYKLIPAVSDFGKIFEGDIAYAIASDRDGNVFVHLEKGPIKKISPDNITTDFATTIFFRANAMKMGPDNLLYVAPSGRIKTISTIAPDGTESIFVSLGPPTLAEPRDLDFDANLNLWVVGGSILFLVKSDKTVLQVATFQVRLLTVRIFDNSVYVAGNNAETGESKIWRSEVQGDGIGAQEVVLDVAAASELQGANVNAITFSEDGEMVLGTTNENGVFILGQGGSLTPLFPGLISPEIYALSWGVEQTAIGEGQILYAVRQRPSQEAPNTFDFSQIFRISMPTRSAPYYGRQ